VWTQAGSEFVSESLSALEVEGCPAVSLLQQRAHQLFHKAAPVLVSQNVASAAAPKQKSETGVLNAVGPVPLSVLAFEQIIVRSKRSTDRSRAVSWIFVVFIVLIALAFLAACAMSVAALRKSSVPSSSKSAASKADEGKKKVPLMNPRTPGPSPSLPSASPLTPNVHLPAQQLAAPAIMHFPIVGADSRKHGTFDIYWGSFDQPWFRLTVSAGGQDLEKLELFEAHDGLNVLQASVVPHGGGRASVLRPDGSPFATLQQVSESLVYEVIKNGGKLVDVCIHDTGESGSLLEARLPSKQTAATVARKHVRQQKTGELLLELFVERHTDAIFMLMATMFVLRQLPPHQDG
jgi:hypothetical protein